MRTKFMACVLVLIGLSALVARDAWAQDAKAAETKPAEAPPAVLDVKIEQGQVQIAQGVQGVQAAGVPMMRMMPAMPLRPANGLQIDLGNVVLAKFDDGPKGAQLVALIEQTRKEMKSVTITAFRQEIRTRKVQTTAANGEVKEVEQQYNVSVPFTQDVMREVQVPVGKKPTAFPFDELRIFRLDGSNVTIAEAKTLLEKTTPVFLLKGFTGDIKPIEGAVLQAINPNCLIVATEPVPQEQAPAIPVDPR